MRLPENNRVSDFTQLNEYDYLRQLRLERSYPKAKQHAVTIITNNVVFLFDPLGLIVQTKWGLPR